MVVLWGDWIRVLRPRGSEQEEREFMETLPGGRKPSERRQRCRRPALDPGWRPSGRKAETQTTAPARPPSRAPGPVGPWGSRHLLGLGSPHPSELDCPCLLQTPARHRRPATAGPPSCRPCCHRLHQRWAVGTSRDVSHELHFSHGLKRGQKGSWTWAPAVFHYS